MPLLPPLASVEWREIYVVRSVRAYPICVRHAWTNTIPLTLPSGGGNITADIPCLLSGSVTSPPYVESLPPGLGTGHYFVMLKSVLVERTPLSG